MKKISKKFEGEKIKNKYLHVINDMRIYSSTNIKVEIKM